jgi:membrane protein YdbS with pleckstrin-like domain
MNRPVDAAAAWIYRGVWASVVALFRIPPDPPTLPRVSGPVRSIRPAPGFLRYLKFFFWLLFVPGDVLPLIGWGAIYAGNETLALALVPLLLLIMIAPDVIAYVAIHLRYDTTWYVLTDRSLRLRRGIWVMHETTISFENVQNVEVRQGPLQRYFGIADVVVQTAGGGARERKGEAGGSLSAHIGILQGLDDAQAVRTMVLDRVRRSRSAGLGDEHVQVQDASLHAPGLTSALSASHLAVLREIRDIARRVS